ncbi:hypothetical protein BDFG_07444, partial [Blastomyces dermatitidis ATCC 26199]
SSCVDRSMSADDSELNVESLIKNLEDAIMKELSVPCVAGSSVSLPASSVSSSAAPPQSSTPAPVSGSLAPAIPVPVTLTSATSAPPGFAVSAFITSSPCFKKMLCRLDESYFSVCTLSLFLLISRTIYYMKTAKDICVFENENADVVLFYTHRCETYTP